MIHGMIVTREGQPQHVRSIQKAPAGYGVDAGPATITLQEWQGTELTRLVDPLATDIPLLPPCSHCGPRFPGDYGSAGWQCRDGCPMGVEGRAALVTA